MTGIPAIDSYAMPPPSLWPENMVDWEPDPRRSVLLIHDMQRYFLRPFGQGALRNALVSNVAKLRLWASTAGAPIAYTAQPGNMSADQRGLLKDFWGPGMQASQEDRQIVEELSPSHCDWLFTKWRYSAFARSDLLSRIKGAGRSQLVICGVYAHIGVLMTAVEAFSNDIETFVVGDAIADFSLSQHLMALEYSSRCCARIISTEEVFQ